MLGRAVTVRAVADRQQAVRLADIVSCATLSKAPLVEGAWLSEGQHIDLVGAYTPEMRECDDDAVRRAQVHVDTRAAAIREAGDIVLPIRSGAITADNIVADLFELARGERSRRPASDGHCITLFKSVGAALEDLAAAELAVER
jgi:ornithine cyclodeaminase